MWRERALSAEARLGEAQKAVETLVAREAAVRCEAERHAAAAQEAQQSTVRMRLAAESSAAEAEQQAVQLRRECAEVALASPPARPSVAIFPQALWTCGSTRVLPAREDHRDSADASQHALRHRS